MPEEPKRCPRCGTTLEVAGEVGAGVTGEYGPLPPTRPVYWCPNCQMSLDEMENESEADAW